MCSDDYGNLVYDTPQDAKGSDKLTNGAEVLWIAATTVSRAWLILDADELLDLNLEQLLQPDFVAKQTRGSFGKAATKASDEKDDKDDGPEDASKLVSQVLQVRKPRLRAHRRSPNSLQESRTQHLTAGFTLDQPGEKQGKQNEDVTARLSRELAAQAFSADSFANLADRRAFLLTTLHTAFEELGRQRRGGRSSHFGLSLTELVCSRQTEKQEIPQGH